MPCRPGRKARNEPVVRLLKLMREPVVAVDAADRIVDLNEAACERFGCRREAAVGESLEHLTRVRDRASAVAPGPSGEYGNVHVLRRPSRSSPDSGRRLVQEIDWLKEALASSADAVLLADGDGRITWVNEAMAEALGRMPERCVGRLLESFLAPAIRSVTQADALWCELGEGRNIQLRCEPDRDECAGEDTSAQWALTPWRAGDRPVSAIVAVRRPLSEQDPV